jgi:hypothetical protein
MRLLIVSSPVAPLGDGRTGGVSLCLENMIKALKGSEHQIDVMAPKGSASLSHNPKLVSAEGPQTPPVTDQPCAAVVALLRASPKCLRSRAPITQ